MNDINDFIDLPKLKSIEFGYYAFSNSLSAIFESEYY